ncbi:hypothetical protein BC834DRAFT_154780 [Gloeopeniophorella convolvens]|nr:hypothetical protein BC834DRAFT_154780 [Gloeopeniophorella convolvens]
MTWITIGSPQAEAWKQLDEGLVQQDPTPKLLVDAAVYHALRTWDEHVRSSGLPEDRATAITLIRQFIASYVHDQIVKHDFRQLWDERNEISNDGGHHPFSWA